MSIYERCLLCNCLVSTYGGLIKGLYFCAVNMGPFKAMPKSIYVVLHYIVYMWLCLVLYFEQFDI